MYIEIQQLKEMGLHKSQIARHLGISRPTVNKYFHMSIETFESTKMKPQPRSKKADSYKDEIIERLYQFPDSSSAQIYDRLVERYKNLPFSEVTLRRYIRILRQELNLPKTTQPRQYEAFEDPPMGKQMQVDFGEKIVFDPQGRKVKLFVMCFVLSHSRYKYCEWQDHPFTTQEIIQIHENAFDFYGGIPEEIVYDQDRLILVSENHRDLIYTHDFAIYHKRRKFRIYMCRKKDPETKGRIENVVGYVKNNFAHNRVFHTVERWNEDCLSWLMRRGNGKEHQTTKKVPAEVFQQEKKYLRPVIEKINKNFTPISITYQVRKDNTVPIKGSRYSVPLGTYQGPSTYVKVHTMGDKLMILELETNRELARHQIAIEKGTLQKNNQHRRQTSKKIPLLLEEVMATFTDTDQAQHFLETIKKEKPRYIRDQLEVIQSSAREVDTHIANQALAFCIKNSLYSAVDFKDATKHFYKESASVTEINKVKILPLEPSTLEKIHTQAQVRDFQTYIDILHGLK